MKETKELLGFVLALGSACGKSIEDGKIGLGDLMHFISAMRQAGDAFEGIGSVPMEWAGMTDVQKEELKAYVVAEFDIPQDALEESIEIGLKVAIDLAYMITKFFS